MAHLHHSWNREPFRVIHPLHDKPEQKCETDGVRPIEMTRTVRISLRLLRGYLLAMSGLLIYHVLNLAGVTSWSH